MPDANMISRKQSSHARQQFPRKAKPNESTVLDTSVTRLELTERSVNILKHRDRDVSSPTVTNSDVKQFEFVTLTSQPTTNTTRATSRTDDQENPLSPTEISICGPLAPINTWQPIHNDGPRLRIFSPMTSSLDPFNSLAIKLGPMSEDLLVHYNTKYTLNCVAINAESNFFLFVKTDPALFHSILYLVALHRDMWIINERLRGGFVFDDVTIAAVAMLVNKKNINGRYELSKMHMQGLEQMVETRGGPQNLSGVFQRIVTW
ncbi:uncharacterized protein PAC_18817 [Phialocephala subalpina]|uniref:Uncharacterized protein n=1 Tax=Phialocephala subalpina TaxID=576137 RepID=A0A1L7XV47_9HELO|nr:uncharacterized protein PAC_18817 [Phialocephala subalpina]